MKMDLGQQVMPKDEYLEKFQTWYKKTKPYLKDTIFEKNYYENSQNHLLEPRMVTAGEEKFIWLNYSKYKSKFLFDKLFNQYLVLALYLAQFQMSKYYVICDNIEEYISFNTERLMHTIKRYDPASAASFSTYFINESNFLIRRYLNEMYSDSYLSVVVKEKFDLTLYHIHQYGYELKDIENMSDAEFKSKFDMSKKGFFAKMNANVVNFTDMEAKLFTEHEKNDITYESTIVDKNSISENVYKMTLNQCKIRLMNDPRISSRDLDIWLMYYTEYKSYTYEEIGTKYDLTRERVRQILQKANRHLKRCKEFKDILKD